jgi:hypothetical protein
MYKNLDELIEKINDEKTLKFMVKISANSRINTIDFCDDFIKIKITQPAIEGKANKALINYLSDLLKIAKSKIKIMNGEKSSIKTIQIKL